MADRSRDRTGSRPPAVVLGSGVTALGVVRALRPHGIETYLVAPDDAIARRSRGVIVVSRNRPLERSEDALERFLRDTGLDGGVLFPCDDDWLRAAAALVEREPGAFRSATAPAATVDRLVDKGAFARTLEDLAIDHPRTFEVHSIDDLAEIDDHELSSFFLKPRDSQRFTKEFHRKSFTLADRRSATEQLERALIRGHRLLAQERVPGPPTDHVFIDGFVERHGRIVGLLARRRIRMYPPGFGNSTDTVTIPLGDVVEAEASLRRLFSAIAYHGLFDAEFKRDGRSGRYKMIEVNARAWWQIALAPAAGVDVVHMAYLDALGIDVTPARQYRIGRRWVHTFPDLRARWETWRLQEERRGERRPMQGWFTARHAVLRWSDPGPGVAEIQRVVRIALDLVRGRLRRHSGASAHQPPR